MSKYDVVIIGAGPGGYVAAIRAAQLGLKTAIVDKQWLGGVCLNVGCIPSKALLRNAEITHILRNRGKEFGFSFENLQIDYSVAVKRSRKVSDRLTKGVGFLMRKNNVDVHMGEATITAENTVNIVKDDGKTIDLESKNIVIATGAHVTIPATWNVDGKQVITYHEAILQEELPESVIIVGGGPIGMEFATIWHAYGVDVTLVEMLPNLLPLEDKDISEEIQKLFSRQGIKTMVGHRVESIERADNRVKVTVSYEDGQKQLDADQALIAIGFTPNSHGLGLEDVGVKVSEKGMVEIDERMATNIPGIWAIGDVTGKLMLAHVASHMGIICAENIANNKTTPINFEMMPRVTFCQPQVASFGLTETQAEERGYDIITSRFPFQANGKALGLGDYNGWVKLITDSRYNEILGAHLIGPEVTELLPELTIAQMMELTPEEISRNVHAHPTLSEIIMEVAHVAEGRPIHT